MCGIAGLIQFNNTSKELTSARINELLNIMKKRGPDSQKFFSTELYGSKINFFSSRLSILDLNKRSNQPFFFKDKVLIYNGELYNFKEIKTFLENKKYKFISNSDTEVIIKAFDYWGEKCLKYFDGMWALALLDKTKKELILTRDFFGEKPLFICYDSSFLAFGSEINYLKKLIDSDRFFKINQNQIFTYLNLGYKFLHKSNETFFQDIKSFDAGTYLKLNFTNNKLILKKFREKVFTNTNNDNLNEIISKSKYLFFRGFERRLRSDVPISFCLSGGIDSGLLVSSAIKLYSANPTCYSIIDSDKRYNENENIKILEKDLNIKSNKIFLKKKKFSHFLDKVDKLVSHKNAPISTISYFIHSLISEQSSKDGNKVIFSGTGADEIFTGYYDHHLFYLSEIKKNKKLFMKELDLWKNETSKYIRNPLLLNYENILSNSKFRDHIMQNSNLFYNKNVKNYKFNEINYSKSNLKNRLLNELYHETVPVMLEEDDSNSMLHSIENRSPYLNYNLVKYIQSIKPKYFINNGFTKFILREIGNNILDDKIRLSKNKKGFNTNLNSLININKKEIIDFITAQKNIDEFINLKNLKNVNFKQLNNSNNKNIFNIINVCVFLNKFN